MRTTTIFAEILVVGVQTAAWIGLLVLSIFGDEWLSAFSGSITDWTALATIVALAAFYTLGVLAERLFAAATWVLTPARLVLASSWVRSRADSILDATRFQKQEWERWDPSYFPYLISRLRIARATLFNVILMSVSTVIFIVTQWSTEWGVSRAKPVGITVALGTVFTLASLVAYAMLHATYVARIQQFRAMNAAADREANEA